MPLAAAEAVCAATLDTLQALVDRSLLRTDGERYWMLETLREYALNRLDQLGELDDLRRAHHAWFSDLLDAEHGDVNRPMMAAASPSAFGRERENIKAALVWALKNRRWRGVDDR